MNGQTPIVAAAVVLVVVLAFIKAFARRLGTAAQLPYEKEAALFTPAERSFLGVLETAVGEQFRVMGKVRLADVIRVKPGVSGVDRQRAFNRIQSKHLDFVLCKPDDLSIVAAVELDDKSHERRNRQDRDAFVDAAIERAGIPLIRFAARESYSVKDVRDRITACIPVKPGQPKEQVQPTVDVVRQPDAEAGVQAPPRCPACGAAMVRRKASRGENAGHEFWGCSTYPKCRKVVPAGAGA